MCHRNKRKTRAHLRAVGVSCLFMFFAHTALAKIHIVATLPDLAALASEIAGDDADVHVLTSPRQDPHYVDARPSLMVELNRADVVLVNGVQLEDAWLIPLLTQSRNPRVQAGGPGFIDASRFVSLLEIPARVDRAQGDIHPGGNPHYLPDPRRAVLVVQGIAERLASLYPAHAEAFRNRAQSFNDRLKRFAEAETARFAQLPRADVEVVAYHRSLIYLFDWLGLTQIATLEPRPGIPPDPGHVAQVLRLMRQHEIRAIVQEEFYPNQTAKTVAQLANATLVVLPGATRFADGEPYLDHLHQITDAIYAAIHR